MPKPYQLIVGFGQPNELRPSHVKLLTLFLSNTFLVCLSQLLYYHKEPC